MSDYEPDREVQTVTGPDGQPLTITSESYGRAHAARQADAEAALAAIGHAGTAVLLTVRCRNRHRLAVVYRTPQGPMVLVYQHDHDDADVRRLRRESGLDVRRAQDVMADPVDAPVDRALEARCKCGGVEIDREELRERLADGAPDWVLS